VHSSTSSSDQRRPSARWLPLLAFPLLLTILAAAGLEYALARRGFEATVLDTPDLWLKERARATRLGRDGIVLVGSSRIQLGIDLPLLSKLTKRPVSQLAIHSASFVPILRGLAQDEQFVGTVVVDYHDVLVDTYDREGPASVYQKGYELTKRGSRWTSAASEAWLRRQIQWRLRAYADGTTPWTSLIRRVANPQATPQYQVTYADRSRAADYSRVEMPRFYFERTALSLGYARLAIPEGVEPAVVEQQLFELVDKLKTRGTDHFRQGTLAIRNWSDLIRSRGGRVVFVVLPTSDLNTLIEQRLYPRAQFWDPFAKSVGADSLHYQDHPETRGFTCPDGSHLDRRDRAAYTWAIATLVFARSAPPSSP